MLDASYYIYAFLSQNARNNLLCYYVFVCDSVDILLLYYDIMCITENKICL